MRACALNHLDIWVRRGWPGLNLEKPHWTGADIAGEVIGLGEGVTGWEVGQRVVVAARSADEGKLFGSIGPRDVAAAIEKFTGVAIEEAIVDLPSPIKEIGLHEVNIAPHPEVQFQLTLDVIPA